MNYSKLVELYENLSSTTKRLEKISLLSKFIKNLSEKDKNIIYLLLGNIYPDYDERKIGISSSLAIKAISKSAGVSEKEVIAKWKKIGDLGEVSEQLIKNKKQSTLSSYTLSTKKVIENLRKLPDLEGKGSVGKKLFLIIELMSSASPLEAKYLIRTLIGDLRIGVQTSTIREALSLAFFKEESASEKIQRAIDRANDLGEIFVICRKKDLKELDKLKLKVGTPIKVMLAQKTNTIHEGFKALGSPCAIEYKYDGFRLLIHKKGKKVILFTRKLENVTKQFPEVIGYVLKNVKGESFILDSEAIGFDKKTKKYQPFQYISQRIRRKYEIERLQKELPVEINVFDIIYYNGKSYLDESFEKRTKLLRKIISPVKYKILPAKQIITSDEKLAKEFYKKALKDNQEGVMMKNLSATYNPGSRVGHMLKIKPDVNDLDLVITGSEYGTGKRKGWMSSFILSCINKKGEFLEIGKVGTGISEKEGERITFKELTEQLTNYILKEKGKEVILKPKVVVSVHYQEIQKSSNYNSGFALRFPRFIALRPDKSPKDISTLEEIKKDFEEQKRNYQYG